MQDNEDNDDDNEDEESDETNSSYYEQECILDNKEECDNKECKKKCYTTVNIVCDKCKLSNDLMRDDIYHCLDCMGTDKKFQVLKNNKYQNQHGFDLCKKCYMSDPKFVANYHTPCHSLLCIKRKEIILMCECCHFYYCNRCINTSKNLIEISNEDYLTNSTYMANKSICYKCLSNFKCPFVHEKKMELLDRFDLPNEIKMMIKDNV